MTTWRPIPGWHGYYSASDDGRVYSHRSQRCLTPTVGKRGYAMVTLSVRGQRKYVAVHRLIAEAFLGHRPEGYETCHGDGDRLNNRIENLRYGTSKGNSLDMLRQRPHPQALKTSCPQGHPYDATNTRRYTDARGYVRRVCRTCKNARDTRRRRAAQRAARFTKAA